MRIGEVARRSRLSTSRIRFYEAHGLLPKAARGDNGYRDYPDDVVEILSLIHDAQGLGFSLSEIRARLAQGSGGRLSNRDKVEALRDKLAHLDRHIAEVALRRQAIVDLIEKLGKEQERIK